MHARHDYKTLRQTFEQAADLYQQARPDYPEALLDDLVQAADLHPGDRLLEIGCATGKATLPLAKRGFNMTCVELGADLAEAARRNLTGMDAEIITGGFEEWQPEAGKRFDLVFAATAWNWIDPKVRYSKAWQVLRPGGHLAFGTPLTFFRTTGICSSVKSKTYTMNWARANRKTPTGQSRGTAGAAGRDRAKRPV